MTQTKLNKALLDKLANAVASSRSNSSGDASFYSALKLAQIAANQKKANPWIQKPSDLSGFTELETMTGDPKGDDSGGPIPWVIDKAMRPLQAVANVALEGSKAINDWTGEKPGDYENPFEAAWKGFSDEQPTTFSDVIMENFKPSVGEGKLFGEDLPDIGFNLGNIGPLSLSVNDANPSVKKAVAGVGGGVLDLAADPLNFVPLGPVAKGISKVGSAISGTTKLGKAAKEGLEVTTAGKAASEEAKKVQIDEFKSKRYQELLDEAQKNADAGASLKTLGDNLAASLAEDLKGSGMRSPDELDLPSFTDTTGQMPRTKIQKQAQEAAAATPMPTFSSKPGMDEAIPATPKPAPDVTFSDGPTGPILQTSHMHFDDALRSPVDSPTFSSFPEPQGGIKLPEMNLPGSSPMFSDNAAAATQPIRAAGKFPDATPTFLASGETNVGDVIASGLDTKGIADAAKPANAGRQAAIGDEIAKAVTDPTVNVPTGGTPRPVKSSEVRDIDTQYKDALSITDAYAKQAAMVKIPTADIPAYVGKNVLDELSAIKQIKAEQGIYPVIKSEDNAYHLDISDVYKGLEDDLPKYQLSIRPSFALKGVAKYLDATMAGLGREETLKLIEDTVRPGIKRNGAPGVKDVTQFARSVFDHGPNFTKMLADNELAYGIRDAAKGEKIADDVSAETVASIEDPLSGVAKSLQDVANITGKIKTAARTEGVGPAGTIHAVTKTMKNLEGKVPINDVAASRTILANAKVIAKGGDKGTVSLKVRANLLRQAKKDAEEAVEAMGPEVGIGDIKELQLDNMIQRGMQGILSRVSLGHGAKELAYRMRNLGSAAEREAMQHTAALGKIYKAHSAEAIDSAYTAIRSQQPLKSITDPAVAAAYTELKPTMDNIVSLSEDPKAAIAENTFFREDSNMTVINAIFKEKGIDDFAFDPMKIPKGGTMADVAKQLLDYQPKSPLEFLEKLKSAQTTFVARKRFGEFIAMEYGKPLGTAGHTRIRPGGDKLAPFIDKSVAYPPEVARMLKTFTDTFDSPTSFVGSQSKAAWLANKVIDPYMRAWKPSVTIARPGHHIRNMVSDFILNGMAGVWSPKHYMMASNVMRAGGKFEGNPEELQKLWGDKPLPVAGDKAFDVVTKAGTEPLSFGGVYQRASKDGLIISGRMAEDVGERGSTALDKVTNRIMDTRYMKGMSKVAEVENTAFRLAQYVKLMQDVKFTRGFRTTEEASHAAITETQKFHPDVKGLTAGEQRWGRRIVPFYSFTRQVLPVVFNTLIEHPSRITALPKVQYNAQLAMGGDPESIENPFDPNTKYPSYVTENLTGNLPLFGGQGTLNLGTPLESVNDLTSGKGVQSLVDQLNPIAKVPYQTITNHDPLTDKYVPDVGEKIDRAIPYAGYASDITATSFAGTLGSVLQGAPTLDPQRARARGEKDVIWNQSLLNFMSGLGYDDINKLSYQKYANKEMGR